MFATDLLMPSWLLTGPASTLADQLEDGPRSNCEWSPSGLGRSVIFFQLWAGANSVSSTYYPSQQDLRVGQVDPLAQPRAVAQPSFPSYYHSTSQAHHYKPSIHHIMTTLSAKMLESLLDS